MARAMNVGKRHTALKSMIARAMNNAEKAATIAAELTTSFKGTKSKEAEKALVLAKTAAKLASALEKAANAVSL